MFLWKFCAESLPWFWLFAQNSSKFSLQQDLTKAALEAKILSQKKVTYTDQAFPEVISTVLSLTLTS